MKPIAVILGTKAEFLRLFPLMLYFQEHGQEYALIHTCQNDLDDYLGRFAVRPSEFIEMTEFAHVEVTVNFSNAVKALQLYRKLKCVLRDVGPNLVVYQGDTFTTGFAAFASRHLHMKSAHIEAGLRSHTWTEPFPEELMRKIADHRADLNFAPSHQAEQNLINEGARGIAVLSGSTVMDGMEYIGCIPNEKRPEGYVLVSLHRYENIFSRPRMKAILTILQLCHIPLKWVMHDATATRLKVLGLWERAMNVGELLPPLDYAHFLGMVARANYVVTDGGNLEEESFILGRPCLLLRKHTERSEFLDCGLTFLSELDETKAKQQLSLVEAGLTDATKPNPYYFGESPSKTIGERLMQDG